jgi:hypothetical protein
MQSRLSRRFDPRCLEAPWRALALAIGALVPLAGGCAENDTTMYVEGILATSPPDCDVVGSPGSTPLYRGTLDVAFAHDYQAAVLIANQLTPRGAKSQLRTETQGVLLEGAEVRLTTAQGALLDEFTVPTGGFVGVDRSNTPGYGAAMVTLIPPGRGQDLEDELSESGRGASRTLIASVRVFGKTLGGVEITSGAYTLPIDVCYGCLISFPLDAVVPNAAGRGVCSENADQAPDPGCFFGQDDMIDCRLCAATMRICENVD